MEKTGLFYYIRFIIPFIRPYWFSILISLICTVLFAVSNVYIMPLVNDLTREIAAKDLTNFTNHVINASLLFIIRLSVNTIKCTLWKKHLIKSS